MRKLIIIVLFIFLGCQIFAKERNDLEVKGLQLLTGSCIEGTCFSVSATALYFAILMGMSNSPNEFRGLLILSPGTLGITPLSVACGIYGVGNKYYEKEQRGSFLFTTIGAYTGAMFVPGVYALTKSTLLAFATGAVLIPISATFSYHWSRPKLSTSQGFLNHFDLPSLGIRPEKIDNGKIITALDLKLINTKF